MIQHDKGTCKICGGTADEPLTYQSQYVQSTVYLCRDCLDMARDTFNWLVLGHDASSTLKEKMTECLEVASADHPDN